MKITKSQLKQLIKEELGVLLEVGNFPKPTAPSANSRDGGGGLNARNVKREMLTATKLTPRLHSAIARATMMADGDDNQLGIELAEAERIHTEIGNIINKVRNTIGENK